MPKSQGARQLRLTTPVNEKEKAQAEKLAKAEGKSVAELVRDLLAQRHKERRSKKSALNPTAAAAKPSRSVRARNGTTGRTANGASKNSLKRGVVSASSKTARGTRRSTKARSAKNRGSVLR